MKKAILSWILILIVAVFCFYSTCHAEVYLIVDKATKAIITASEKNDTIVSAEQELITLPGDFETLNLKEHPTNLLYKNNKFIKNTVKIDAETAKEEAEAQKKNKEEQARVSAKAKIKALGLTDDEVAVLFKGE